MFDLFSQLSDDQLAIGGSLLALLATGLLVQLAYSFGPTAQETTTLPINRLPQTGRRSDDQAA
jgi:hypothetical protein